MSVGAVSLNMVWSSAIKGSSFLQASVEGIHTYAKKVTEANLLRATKFGILNKNVKTLDNHLTKLSAKVSFISKNPIKIDVNRKELMETRKDLTAIERSSKRSSFFTSKIKTPQQKTQQHSATSTVVGVATVATIMTLPFKSSIEFESKMARVKALTNSTNKEFKQLNNTALFLGGSTAWSSSQVAEGMQFLSMAGFKANQTISAMPGLLSLATAGATDLSTTADIASNIMGGFGIKPEQTIDGMSAMNFVADVMAKTITTANVDMQMLGDTMKYVGPVAKKAGMSLQETASMAGLLGNIGIQGSQAGTTLKAMLLRLSAPTGGARKALEQLGVSALDSQGNIRSLPLLLSEVAKATKNMGSGTQLGYIKKIFGEEPAAGMADLIEKSGTGALQKYITIVNDYKGSAKKIADIQLASTAGQFKLLGSAMEGLSISATTGLLPTIRTTTQGLTSVAGLVSTFTKDFPGASKWVFGLGTAFILGSVAIAGFGFMAGAVGSGLALLSSPITLIVGGIMAVGAAGYYLYNKFDGFKTSINGLFGGISDVVMPLAGAFKNAFIGIGSSIIQIARPIGGLLMAIGGLFGGFKTLGIIAKGVGWVIGGVFTAITTPILTVVELIRTAIGSVALIVDSVASFLGFGDDEPKKATDTKIKTITKPVNNTDYKTTLSTTKKEEQSFFSKWFGSDNKSVTNTSTNIKIPTVSLSKNFKNSGVIETPTYTNAQSFNDVTNKYNSPSSSLVGNSQKTVSQTFNFNGGINITATDGKIDEEGFRTQIEQILRDIQLEQQDTQLRDIA